jgi:hypothetical protein
MAIPDSVWSAPLDDTFIHFDFARSLARGFPFQWVEGNGYSSGGTSALYPFALAVGYWLGFRQTTLMLWAGIVACVSILITLLAARRLFVEAKLPDACAYLLPPMFLGIGALDWSLFSGMEVAFFMAVWAGCLLAWLAARRSVASESMRRALWLGIAAAALVATRPEAICLVAVFALTLAALKLRPEGVRASVALLTISCAPALLVMVGQAVANRLLTGEWSAAGALVKLEINHPYLSAKEIWGAWGFHVKYQALRVTEYHLAAPLAVRADSVDETIYPRHRRTFVGLDHRMGADGRSEWPSALAKRALHDAGACILAREREPRCWYSLDPRYELEEAVSTARAHGSGHDPGIARRCDWAIPSVLRAALVLRSREPQHLRSARHCRGDPPIARAPATSGAGR